MRPALAALQRWLSRDVLPRCSPVSWSVRLTRERRHSEFASISAEALDWKKATSMVLHEKKGGARKSKLFGVNLDTGKENITPPSPSRRRW